MYHKNTLLKNREGKNDEMVENERKYDNTGDFGGPLRRSDSEASKSPKKLRALLRTFGCPMGAVLYEHYKLFE
ncbi:MAG: hypothetical protein HQL27_07710 [Candidatus Omnitrophica bacterium]|nr:hypothetical protein [Candidatus Omnitrophota bacterium]